MAETRRTCVVIPELNEFDQALRCGYKILQTIPTIDQIIVVDDGSKSWHINVPPNVRVLYNHTNRGVGYSLIEGLKNALEEGFDYIITWGAIDRGIDLFSFQILLGLLEQSDVVLTQRFLANYDQETSTRRFAIQLHKWLFKLKTGRHYPDTTIGMRGFRANVLRKLLSTLSSKQPEWFWRYGFEVWLLIQIARSNYKIDFCWTNLAKSTNSHIRVWGKNSFIHLFTPFIKEANID